MKKSKEFYCKAPWGKIALVSWGNPSGPPVLLLHGYMDTAATFILLVEQLPDKYHYVAIDMPGHGKSDPFPPGLIISQVHMVEALRVVVEHLKWKRFTFMAHSMGCIIGLLYNGVFPGRMRSCIFLDVPPPIATYFYAIDKLPVWFSYYKDYYDNMNRFSSPKLYTQDQVVSLLVRNRDLTEEQAEVVLSRSLVIMGIDTYKLSWEPRMKKIYNQPMSEDMLYTLLTANSVPTLSLEASETVHNTDVRKSAENLLRKRQETLQDLQRVTVTGGHDVHITNPERVVPHIVTFLERNSVKRSKL